MVTTPSSVLIETTTSPAIVRRSTRRAALTATARIAQELAPQRRSTRLTTRNNHASALGVSTTTTVPNAIAAASSSSSTRSMTGAERNEAIPRRATHESKEAPIMLDSENGDDTRNNLDSLDLKPAASVPVAGVALLPLSDFICAICLDAPPAMTEVASISGCTHQFCFDCIETWAETENRCPCCKARFRTIDRVVALPASPVETPSKGGRRGKRKRSHGSSDRSLSPSSRWRSGGSTSASPSSPAQLNHRPNSRTVEDRNQQSMGIVVDAAFVQNILATFLNATTSTSGGGGTASFGGAGQVTFGTSEDGRPVIRVINPQAGGMVGIMEMFLTEGSHTTAQASSDSRRGAGGTRASSTSSLTRTTIRPLTLTGQSIQQILANRGTRGGSEAATSAAATQSSTSVTTEGTNTAPSTAADQARSAFANLFATLGNSARGTTSSTASPRSRRGAFSAGSNSSIYDTPPRSSAGSGQRMTIRISSYSPSSRHTSHTSRSINASTASSTSSDGGATSTSDNEPIVID